MISPAYASLLRRYQALVLDGVLYIAALVIALFLPAMLGLGTLGNRVFMISLITFIVLYEPLLVGLRRGTIGHFRYGLRVVDAVSGQSIGVPRAFGRGFVKGLLGAPSFMFLYVTNRAQALHDMAVRSVVVVADPGTATDLDVIVPIPVPVEGMPSKLRRVMVIAAYAIATGFLLMVFVAIAVPGPCLEHNICSAGDQFTMLTAGITSVVATGVFLVKGWRGHLRGCRRTDASEVAV